MMWLLPMPGIYILPVRLIYLILFWKNWIRRAGQSGRKFLDRKNSLKIILLGVFGETESLSINKEIYMFLGLLTDLILAGLPLILSLRKIIPLPNFLPSLIRKET